MEKYSLIPQQLIYEGTCVEANFFEPNPLAESQITRTHSSVYWEKLKNQTLSKKEERKTGFPLSPELAEREIRICQGTIDNANFAMEFGVSMNIAGGTHHAYRESGEGFCLLNDIAIASHYLLDHKNIQQIIVVDLDVHQGNGTAKIMEKENRVFTFSMHGENNYPLHKENSDLDLGLKDGMEDDEYLSLLKETLPKLIHQLNPDFIFYQAGVDILKTDKLGRLGLSMDGCRERDRFVLQTCKDSNIPLAINMGGGYSEKIGDIVEAHANTFRLAQEIWF